MILLNCYLSKENMKKLFTFFVAALFSCSLFAENLILENPKKLLIICDMWENHIGGVEEVVNQLRNRLPQRNYEVKLMGLADVPVFSVPGMGDVSSPYPWGIKGRVATKISEFKPDHILIVLHGIMSQKSASYCADNNIPFTAFYPGRGPECVYAMSYIPMFITRYFINSFLSKASSILVPSASMRDELIVEGFKNVIAWPHGIDLDTFSLTTLQEKQEATKACNLEGLPRPFYVFVGRISAEKNIPAFLNAKVAGTKIVVGPQDCGFNLESLRKDYPEIIFAGPKRGKDLLNYYKCADIFLFPSKMDSFGLVMLEALATGLPVVGFNTFGPRDVVPKGSGVSYLADSDEEFEICAKQAWKELQAGLVTPEQCRAYASKFSWGAAMDIFEESLIKINA